MSETVSSSGQGPNATFNTNAEGCATWDASQSQNPLHTIHMVFDTGDDDLASTSTMVVNAFDSSHTLIGTLTAHPANAQKFDNDTEHSKDLTLAADLNASQIATLEIVFTALGNDEWHIFGFTAFGRTLTANGQDTCLVRNSSEQTFNNTHNIISFPTGIAGGCF